MNDLKLKLLNEFNVELIEPEYMSLETPTVTLKYKEEHNKFIERNPAAYDINFFKTKAENIAHLKGWANTFNIIENVFVINSRPYDIQIQAIEPLIFAFVLSTLSK